MAEREHEHEHEHGHGQGHENEPTLIADHEYDGILEYDNPTPGWWHLLFLASIVFSVVYFFLSLESPFFVHQTERLEATLAREQRERFGALGDLENEPQTLLALADSDEWMRVGDGLFRAHCASCHGAGGQGMAGQGPNMHDDYYKNITDITGLYRVIRDGANNGAMPAHANRLSENEMVLLAAYAASLRGTPVDGGKQPEGEVVGPWPDRDEGFSLPGRG